MSTRLVRLLKNYRYSERLRKLGLPTLEYRRERADLIQVYQILNNIDIVVHPSSDINYGVWMCYLADSGQVRSDMKKGLETIQRKAQALCLGLPTTSSGEALEVAAGVVLLDLFFSEIAIATTAKIMAKLHRIT